ncbi:MAG TPA: hypothetical protein PKO15_10915 [Fibrobacteria bacterium]|nr:hypothetical protein [Fibrobacteria bacterium]
MKVTVQVDNLSKGLLAAERWVARMGLSVLEAKNNREESWQRKASMTFSVPDTLFGSLKDSLSKLGKPIEYSLDMVSKADEIEKLSHELRFRQSEKEVYAQELKGVDRAKEAHAYNTLWGKAREIDNQIFRLEESLIEARQAVRGNQVDLTLEEPSEPPTTTGKRWVEFTNMPGGEFTYVSVENPKSGLSAGSYMGGSVRYLFTKGKSYLVLGVLKSQDHQAGDSTVLQDMFLYAYGTDFYPRHFGRGQRNYLNLYSGFTVGGLFLSSQVANRHLVQVTPHVGVELFKGKQVLLDVRGGYLLPLDSDLNLHLRGWTVSPSLNFVF